LTITSDESEAALSGGLYRRIWRWHFYAGLAVAPFVLILAFTGLLYLFDDELSVMLDRNLRVVTPQQSLQSVGAQEAAVRTAYPDAKLLQYMGPAAPDRSAAWGLTASSGESVTTYVDPYTAEIIGSRPSGQSLGEVLVRLHGDLMVGPAGDYLVEFAACWTFVLLVTGLFLWWPRRHRRAGVLAPRLSAKGRSFWRELHSVPAAWNAPVVAFLILTGLPWSSFWGGTLASMGTMDALAPVMAPTPNFHAAPSAPDPHAAHRAEEARRDNHDLPWSVRNSAYPTVFAAPHTITIDQVLIEAAKRNMTGDTLKVFYPTAAGEVYTLSYTPAKAEGQRTVYVNPSDGVIVDDISWSRYSPLGKAVEFGVQTHVGKQFGLANQLFMAGSCLILIASVLFGLVMWWKRRPGSRLAGPIPGPHVRTPAPVIWAIVALGVVFPLVGLSLVLIILVELARRHLRPANI
jgi:uncharacterized iron-regulated membrane protein